MDGWVKCQQPSILLVPAFPGPRAVIVAHTERKPSLIASNGASCLMLGPFMNGFLSEFHRRYGRDREAIALG
jgi:hypothetical protein